MAKWIRFEQNGKTRFGTLEGDTIAVHSGDLFAGAKPTGQALGEDSSRSRTRVTGRWRLAGSCSCNLQTMPGFGRSPNVMGKRCGSKID